MSKKKQKKINQSLFNQMDRESLLKCSKILGVETTKMIKGGIFCELSNNQLRSQINRCLGQGTFSNRIERLTDFLSEWIPTNIAPALQSEPSEHVRKLIEDIRCNFDRLSSLQKLEVLSDWVENPQECSCYEELDFIAEKLGFSYEEIEDEFVLVVPSSESMRVKIASMSDADFYHSVVTLAGLVLPNEKYSNPPSILDAGYDFLENLAKYFADLAMPSRATTS